MNNSMIYVQYYQFQTEFKEMKDNNSDVCDIINNETVSYM